MAYRANHAYLKIFFLLLPNIVTISQKYFIDIFKTFYTINIFATKLEMTMLFCFESIRKSVVDLKFSKAFRPSTLVADAAFVQ